jgi:hypothetical protein
VPTRESPTNFDVVAPIKARACGALHAVLGSKPVKLRSDQQLMRKGIERC